MKVSRSEFVSACASAGLRNPVTRTQLVEVSNTLGLTYAPGWIVNDPQYKAGRGLFNIPFNGSTPAPVKSNPAPVVPAFVPPTPAPVACESMNLVLGMTGGERDSLVPNIIDTYVPWGHFTDVDRIISTGMFFPVFITGLSGNGKTTMVEQVCAKLGRECYRANFTKQTEEDDLLGGFRLFDGNMKYLYGPVVNAMLNGGVLLLDEIDLGGPNIMCLQSVLEGKGVYLKKVNKWITPAPGFTIIATANTKGKGSAGGQFVGTNVMNEAMLDRFPLTLEQEYPDTKVELKILRTLVKALDSANHKSEFYKNFTNTLTVWASMIRQSYAAGEVSEIVSTRRLCDIIKAYTVFGDEKKCLAYALNRFDDDTKAGFISLYAKLSGTSIDAETGAGMDSAGDSAASTPTVDYNTPKAPF